MAGTLLNYVEVELSKEQIQIKAIDSDKSIKDFRLQCGDDFHFYFFDNRILYWPKRAGIEDTIGGKNYLADKTLQPQVYSKIIENAIVDLFYNLKNPNNTKAYRVFKNKHHHLWEFTSNKNEVEDTMSGLAMFRKITLHPVYLKPKDKVITGFTISASLKFRFEW